MQAAAKAGAGASGMAGQADPAAVGRVAAPAVQVDPVAAVPALVDPVVRVPVAAVEVEAIKQVTRKL